MKKYTNTIIKMHIVYCEVYFSCKGVLHMPRQAAKDLSGIKGCGDVHMGAKITNQINTNQQSNMVLSAYCVATQNCSTVNINFA